MKGKYTSDEVFLGWLPGRTRHAVAIDLGEGLDTRNDREQQTLASCKSSVGGVNACTLLKRTKLKGIVIFDVRKIDKRMYLQMHLLSVMLHGGPVRFSKKWSSPPEIEIIFIGINPSSIREIFIEYPCHDFIRTVFLEPHWANPIINHVGV